MNDSYMAWTRGLAVCSLVIAVCGCVDDLNESADSGAAGCTVGCGTLEAGSVVAWEAGAAPSDAQLATPPADASSAVPDGGSQASGEAPCAIQTLLRERCAGCHANPPAFGATVPLVRYADLQAASKTLPSRKVFEVMKVRVNMTGPAHMPPASATQLSADELATLNGWLDRGAPASQERCAAPDTDAGAAAPQPVDTTGLECHRFLAHAQGDKAAKFKVGLAVDAYYAMAFRAPWQSPVYGIVVQPIIDNEQAVHHWLLYREDGVDGSITQTIGQHAGGQLIQGWAPGGTPLDFRKFGDVGFELPAATYVLELHYNSSDPNAVDASGVELCVQKTTPKNVATLSWLGHDNWPIALDFGGPSTSWTGTCVPISQEPIHLLFVTPHMHQAGRHMKATIDGPNGTRILHDAPFDFSYQITYEKNEILMPGESITTTCTFSEPKSFGQATSEEMCYLFTYAYPKGALVDIGLTGAFQHGEGTCLGQ